MLLNRVEHFCRYVLIWGVLAAFTSPASAQTDPSSPYQDGLAPPQKLLGIGDGAARTQQFLAEGKHLQDLQLYLAPTTSKGPGAALHVEIRNAELTQRFAHGEVAPFDGKAKVPIWTPVVWANKPVLTPNRLYVIVMFTSAPTGWKIAAGPTSLYAHGTGHHSLGFRTRYRSGKIRNSEFRSGEQGIAEVLWASGKPSEYDVHTIVPISRKWPDVLPQCDGARCADFRHALRGTPTQRRERVKERFKVCSASSRPLVVMHRPTLGVSCRDVCGAFKFKSCVGARRLKNGCASVVSPPLGSCDRIMAGMGPTREVGCLCSAKRRRYDVALRGAPAAKMIRDSYVMGRNQTPVLKAGAEPYGVTCNQVCSEFGHKACTARSGCQSLTLPWAPTCKRCGPAPKRPAQEFRIVEAGELAVFKGRDSVTILDPDTLSTVSVQVPYHTRVSIRDGHLIWIDRSDSGSRIHVMNAETHVRKEFTNHTPQSSAACSVKGSAGHLARVCAVGKRITITSLSDGSFVRTSLNKHGLSPVSWDGVTLWARDKRSKSLFAWTRSQHGWKPATPWVDLEALEPSWTTSVVLDRLYIEDPAAAGFIDHVFYKFDLRGLWSYDTRTKVFQRWRVPPGQGVISNERIRRGAYFFDFKRKEMRELNVGSGPVWVGNYAFVDAENCPKANHCRRLPKPYQTKSVVKIDTGSSPAIRVIAAEPIEVQAP